MSTKREPVLSVLVPTYNYARFITEALESVLSEGIEGVEIVVVDDGSTDGTAELLRPYVESGAIEYRFQSNGGPSTARNTAIEAARGSLLMFLDADDMLLPGCIAHTLAFMDKHEEIGLLFTNYEIFEDQDVVQASGVDTWTAFRQIPHEEVGPLEWLFTESITEHIIRYGSFMHTSGLAVRREVIEKAGQFRIGYFYGEDDEFFARAAYHCRAGYIDRVLARKRKHPASIIHDPTKRARNIRHLLELTQIQLEDYAADRQLRKVLRRKLRGLAAIHVWHSMSEGTSALTWELLGRYIWRYPLHWPLYRLAARAVFRNFVS